VVKKGGGGTVTPPSKGKGPGTVGSPGQGMVGKGYSGDGHAVGAGTTWIQRRHQEKKKRAQGPVRNGRIIEGNAEGGQWKPLLGKKGQTREEKIWENSTRSRVFKGGKGEKLGSPKGKYGCLHFDDQPWRLKRNLQRVMERRENGLGGGRKNTSGEKSKA